MPRAEPKRSDASCWAPRADKHMPDALLPICADCGVKKSVGGNFVSFEASFVGQQIGVVRFTCGCTGEKSFMLMSKHIFPGWKIIRVMAPGVLKLKRLTEEEQNEECSSHGD